MGLTYDLTLPPTDIDAQPTLCLKVSRDWLGVLMSLTERAEFVRSWVEGTDIERAKQNAWKLNSILLNALTCAESEPPFNDETNETVGDRVPADNGQTVWYENVADWVIEGFLATTFTPAAAVVYRTTIPRARILIRRGLSGAGFRVLLDGIEQLTGSSQNGETDLLPVEFETGATPQTPVEIKVIHNGPPPSGGGGGLGGGGGVQYTLTIVRGNIVPPISLQVRQNGENPCTLEQSTDGQTWAAWANLRLCKPDIRFAFGGIQWRDSGGVWRDTTPETDGPRYDGKEPPYPDGNPNSDYTDTPCFVAVSLMRWFRQTTEYVGGFGAAAAFATAGFLAAKGAVEILFGGPFGWAAGLSSWLSAFGAVDAGQDIATDLSAFNWDNLTCIFENRLTREDGYIETAQWEQIATDLDSLSSPVGKIVNFLADMVWVGGARVIAAMGLAGEGHPDSCCTPVDVWQYQPKTDMTWNKDVLAVTGDNLVWPANEGFRKYSRVRWDIGSNILIRRLWIGGTFRGAAKITVNGIEFTAGGRLQGCYMPLDRPFVANMLTIECETGTGDLDVCHYEYVRIEADDPGGGVQSTAPDEWEICP